MSIEKDLLNKILRGAIFASDEPLTIARMKQVFEEDSNPQTNDEIKASLQEITELCEDTGIQLKETGSGYRFQVIQDVAPWIKKLWEERAPRYSKAILETLALMAYRQPITRAEIEEVRGVAVSTHIIRGLLDREWIKVLGHKDVPGKPALYGTTKKFLDYFNVKNLSDLPPLSELQDLDEMAEKLDDQLELDIEGEPKELEAETKETLTMESEIVIGEIKFEEEEEIL